MQALPFATQLLARLGADVVKVESPGGELGRGLAAVHPRSRGPGPRRHLPAQQPGETQHLHRPEDRPRAAAGARHGPPLRRGRGELPRRDDGPAGPRLRATVVAVHPTCVYASVSGFGSVTTFAVPGPPGVRRHRRGDVGHLRDEAGRRRAALASPVGGARRHQRLPLRRRGHPGCVARARPDRPGPARRRRHVRLRDRHDRHRRQLLVDGPQERRHGPVINHGFRAGDGWFVVQVGREHHFERLAEIVGRPEWATDPRLADRQGWMDHLETVLRPAIEHWAGDKTREEACEALGGCRHRRRSVPARRGARRQIRTSLAHHMLVGIERPRWRGATGARSGQPDPHPHRSRHRRHPVALGGRADGRDPAERARSSRRRGGRPTRRTASLHDPSGDRVRRDRRRSRRRSTEPPTSSAMKRPWSTAATRWTLRPASGTRLASWLGR